MYSTPKKMKVPSPRQQKRLYNMVKIKCKYIKIRARERKKVSLTQHQKVRENWAVSLNCLLTYTVKVVCVWFTDGEIA